ncbi:iron complex transport system permease protein [Melghiribacillus thermohalophilus]|uniref:Iron complex transport system permease protein n=1 Tax=Melghiribacillus thermohalophilus TaxID=1324956 RepID=A0A4R3N5G3_9BACI|nr:iron ABC transporter permease [Melghiribacillus thermohalophilus]TCT22373.1 iron complex transport system permease protein [Melghiribacillus thermohalophilus]
MKEYLSIRNKTGSISLQLQKKFLYVLFLLVLFSSFVIVLSLSVGSSLISPLEVIKYLFGYGSGEHDFTLYTLRMPRVFLGFLVGAALGVSGLILQGIIRNPLASPDIIGITGGASVGAIIFMIYFMGTFSLNWLPLAAITGAAIVSIFIYALSWKKGVTPIRLVLIGIGVAAAMNAIVTIMIVISETAVTTKAYLWLTGSLYGGNWEDVILMLPWMIMFIPLTLLFSRAVNANELGDEMATGLGVRVQWTRLSLLLISVALAGSAVAFAGGIGFVGLIAPHIARMMAGRMFGGLVFISALIGGSMVVLADVVARTAFLPLDIPAGVFTSGIGAPFFIYLLYRNRHNIR